MTEYPDTRRHSDGSIDFDSYRTHAAALRRQAMREAAMPRMTSVGTLVMAGALGFAIAVPSTAAAVREHASMDWPDQPLVR